MCSQGHTIARGHELELKHEHLQALIMRVIVMSREEVYQMPPAERENIIKLVRFCVLLLPKRKILTGGCSHKRTTLGLPI